jgi:hypothetical protein
MANIQFVETNCELSIVYVKNFFSELMMGLILVLFSTLHLRMMVLCFMEVNRRTLYCNTEYVGH